MSSISDDNPSKGLSEFFHTIWKETPGYVYLPTINRETGDWRKVMFEWPIHEEPIIQHVLASTAKGLDAYYSPAIYKSRGNPVKDNVLGTHVLWTEFDGGAPKDWTGEGGEDADEAHSDAQRVIPPPSLRVQSSKDGHEHVYWALSEFCTDIAWIEDKNRSITYSKRADTSGWDATQILRPPYTTNYKRNLPVTVTHYNDNAYPVAAFAGLKPPVQIVTESIVIDKLPPIDEIIAKYKWDPEHFALFKDSNIEEGKRSHALMRLGYFCAEAGMSDTEAYAVLLNADDRWGKYKGRADRKRRLVDIINRARQKHPTATSALNFAGLLGDKSEAQPGLALTYGFQDFLDSEVHVEWAIEGLLEKGGMGMVTAMAGVGKTQWSIQMAIDAALGEPFLGWNIPEGQKMVLLSLEMGHVALKMFMETIARQYNKEQMVILQERLIIIPIGEVVDILKPDGMQFLFSLLDEIKPGGIIVDAIGKLTMEELNEKTARSLNDRFSQIRKRYACFMWLIHHMRKASDNNKKPNSLADVYGNMYLTTDMTSVVVLWTEDRMEGKIEVISVKSRLAPMRRTFSIERNENLHFVEAEAVADVAAVMHIGKGDGYATKDKKAPAERPEYGDGAFGGLGNL